ncbi:YgiQ family radical SAM protein [Liberiplasma polymorphum]|uniref:YgiQ family radical SAM protein n=1 Tax=Liberiplasma polymorphum TaxID=3374570 RepID=UPI00377624CB
MNSFIAMTKEEMQAQGFEQADFIIVTGDAYIDHPSFGHAIIARTLQRFNYNVAIIAQPNMNDSNDFLMLGTPKYGFLVTAGNIDSMVNHYTVAKKRRKQDAYTPGGRNDKRPDRATIKYSKKIRELFGNIPIIIGGIEASLRRLSHYDYWDNTVRRSILLDSGADLLVYGMAEKTIVEVADYLASGLNISDIIFLRNTVWKTKDAALIPTDSITLPSYDEVLENKKAYVKSFQLQYKQTDAHTAKILVEHYNRHIVIQNQPAFALSQEEMDQTYDLPFQRAPHPSYTEAIPAIEEVKLSLISNRGCFGGCNFCALTFHQGRTIQSRSKPSLLKEAHLITMDKDFKGYIHDVGGPTANFYEMSCQKQVKHGVCTHKDCIGYTPCEKLEVSHDKYLDILQDLRTIPTVKKVFVRSGIRYDYLMYDKNPAFFEDLVKHHISGQLKIAPEHIDDDVLKLMGKPSQTLYDSFVQKYNLLNKKFDKNQYLVPYLMSSHPGSTLESAVKLALYLKKNNQRPEQVQDFYPTPGTASTCMYYTEIDPFTNEKVYVPKDPKEKAMQRALIQYTLPSNYALVKAALEKTNHTELIGFNKHCLIKPHSSKSYKKAI